jgi:hypothetical protein
VTVAEEIGTDDLPLPAEKGVILIKSYVLSMLCRGLPTNCCVPLLGGAKLWTMLSLSGRTRKEFLCGFRSTPTTLASLYAIFER